MRQSGNVRTALQAYKRGYRVREDGVVTSPFGGTRKLTCSKRGYYRFGIKVEAGVRQVWVHLLASYQKFGEAAFAQGVTVRHLNGNSRDNRSKNLAIGSQSVNVFDRPRAERLRHARVAARVQRRLTPEQVLQARCRRKAGAKLQALADDYGVAKSTMSYVLSGKTYKDVGAGGQGPTRGS